jgi:hypothetical protein
VTAGKNMETAEYLLSNRKEILEDALSMLLQTRLKHYDLSEEAVNRERLEALFDLAIECAKSKSLVPIIEYSETIARERHKNGFDFHEVHSAYNVLEEASWQNIIKGISDSAKLADALGVISTVLGTGKEALASTYINLSVKIKKTDFDLYGFTGRK